MLIVSFLEMKYCVLKIWGSAASEVCPPSRRRKPWHKWTCVYELTLELELRLEDEIKCYFVIFDFLTNMNKVSEI